MSSVKFHVGMHFLFSSFVLVGVSLECNAYLFFPEKFGRFGYYILFEEAY